MNKPHHAAGNLSMPRVFLIAALLTALAVVAAACGDADGGTTGDMPTPAGAGEIVPIAVNSELAVGPNRFALGLMDEEKRPILEAPGTGVHFRFFHQDDLKAEHDAVFTWADPGVSGFFAATVDFEEAGPWQAEVAVTRDGVEKVVTFAFSVVAESKIPNTGDPAPPTRNLTLAEVPDLTRISTDPEPEPALYEMSVAEALEAGRPLVVVFATPAFCRTQFCGPIVENVKEVREEFAGRVSFIHIEPFALDNLGQLVTDEQGAPVFVDAAAEWGLVTEPWLFVVDSESSVAARFEGATSPAELRDAVQQALS
jgi:hypothetical protein